MKIKYPLLIDGGLSNELEKQGYGLNVDLWSAKLLGTNEEAIIKAHIAYLESGAQCITTSSYQATMPGFLARGFNQNDAESLIIKSVKLAEIAINRFLEISKRKIKPFIAASIGPYGAFLADGSEYRGDYKITNKELNEFHISRIELLDKSNADFFACETIPSFQETKVLADILKKTNKSAWISFSCKGGNQINDGTNIEECVRYLAYHPNIFAIGVNCTAPKYVSELIKSIKKNCADKRIVVYPNSGEVYNAKTKTWSNSSYPDIFLEMAQEWIDLGADIIGGCCRIGTEHIQALNKSLFKN